MKNIINTKKARFLASIRFAQAFESGKRDCFAEIFTKMEIFWVQLSMRLPDYALMCIICFIHRNNRKGDTACIES